MEFLQYAPRYFGPNAFPIPELRPAMVGSRFEVELRGEYHDYTGDQTKDLFGRVYLPFVKGRAAVEVSFVYKEDYKMTPETRDERHAYALESPISYNGDVVISALFQAWKSEKWVDLLVSINLKTASGGRLVDARFTDAASYWMDLTVGRDLIKANHKNISLRMMAMGGFYCWMTNDVAHRQNDAISFGVGLTATYRNFTLSTDLSGFHGYEKAGDSPLILRNVLNYEYKKNILSARYHHGMRDRLYETYGLAYIRCF